MLENNLTKLATKLDALKNLIVYLKTLQTDPIYTDISEELAETIKQLDKKYKKLKKEYKSVYKEMLEFADFLSSVDYD